MNGWRELIENIRSDKDDDRNKTIEQIPTLLLDSVNKKDDILNQLLLVIYNLHTDMDNFERLNMENRTVIIRYLLRLYTETINEHKPDQIDALVKLIEHYSHSPQLLIEIANTLHHCDQPEGNNNHLIEKGLNLIKEKASEYLYNDTLLMVYSILSIRSQ